MIWKAPLVVLFIGLIFMVVGIFAPSSCSNSESSDDCDDFALLEKSFFEEDIRGNNRTFEDALALNHQGLNIAIGIVAVLLVLVIRPKTTVPLWIVAFINLALVANARFYFGQVFYKDDGFGDGFTAEWGWYPLFIGVGIIAYAAFMATIQVREKPAVTETLTGQPE